MFKLYKSLRINLRIINPRNNSKIPGLEYVRVRTGSARLIKSNAQICDGAIASNRYPGQSDWTGYLSIDADKGGLFYNQVQKNNRKVLTLFKI